MGEGYEKHKSGPEERSGILQLVENGGHVVPLEETCQYKGSQ